MAFAPLINIGQLKKFLVLWNNVFGTNTEIKDRPVRLIYLHVRKYMGTLTVSDCKGYWEHHSALSSCFTDLRPLLETLPTGHLKEFCLFIQDHAKAAGSRVDTKKVCVNQSYRFKHAEDNLGCLRRLASRRAKLPKILISTHDFVT